MSTDIKSDSLAPLAYSVPQLAEAMNVSPAFLWLEISLGNLESAKVGRRRLITVEQAKRYLDRHIVKREPT